MKDQKQKTIEQFDKWADEYEKGLWGRYFKKSNREVFELLKTSLPPQSNLLDVGCGTGGLLAIVSEYFQGDMVGIDMSSEMLKCAKNKNNENGVRFICSDIEEVNLGSQKFHAVICMNSFHHYLNHKNVVNKISDHLKENGLFILLDPVTDKMIRRIWVRMLNAMFKETGVKYFSTSELNTMMSNEGFSIKKQQPFMYFAMLSVFEKDYKVRSI